MARSGRPTGVEEQGERAWRSHRNLGDLVISAWKIRRHGEPEPNVSRRERLAFEPHASER